MITSRREQTLDLTVLTATGSIDAGQLMDAIEEFYAGDPTRLVLWDLSGVDVTGTSFDDVQAITDLAVKHGDSRRGGKTAIITAQPVTFSIGRFYESKVGDAVRPLQIHVCWTLEEALAFLEIEALPDG